MNNGNAPHPRHLLTPEDRREVGVKTLPTTNRGKYTPFMRRGFSWNRAVARPGGGWSGSYATAPTPTAGLA